MRRLMNDERPVRPLRVPKWLAVALLPAAACPGPNPNNDDGGQDSGMMDGGDDGGTDGGQNLCPPGCDQYRMPDGVLVFYPDGGPYCLC
jgi:hypothetical protein